jgi:hypothetical protein
VVTGIGRLHGMGPTALRLIREALQERGLTLGQPTGSYGEGRVAAEHG